MDIPKQYDPRTCEEKWYSHWEEKGLFKPDPESGREPFVIVIPPPNVTGVLHTGHALGTALQDILIRWKRMAGYDALYLPGTDHAGIATQMVVSKELEAEGTSRWELGREKFLERVWQWKEEKGNRILFQLRKLGACCDWSRTRFTMDSQLSKAVRQVFVNFYGEGLIYRGEYMVNWCPICSTALSDLEVEHADTDSHLWYVRYPLEGGEPGEGITVATTRPETMLGDTAVAVHPEDARYRDWIGRHVILPLMNRRIPVIPDTMVDREFGTGAVKITPAHDPNDFEAGRRHDLEEIRVIGKDGRMTAKAGAYEDLDRFAARKKILEDLKNLDLLVKITPHKHAVGHCQRCDTVLEPMISDQWFLKIQSLAAPAVKAVEDGEIRITPDHWRKVYLNWMREIHDWCISRQLWWGHRIPAYSCGSCGKAAGSDDPDRLLVSMNDLDECPYCGGAVDQDPDVLDTWFSSALWPFSTMGWPDETVDMKHYYPTSVMETGYDILFFWVARMIMAGLKFTGKVPFTDVFLHGLVRDAKGRKMSKTLGNVVDPVDLIETYGADAVRFTLAILCAPGTDIPLDPKRMEGYRSFANKLWNAARFVLLQLDDKAPSEPAMQDMGPWDRWILEELDKCAFEVNDALREFRFYEAAQSVYRFVWHRYCDWYVEASKVALNDADDPRRAEAARWVLVRVLDGVLRLLHPFMPFITEELWQKIPGREGSIMTQPYPEVSAAPLLREAPSIEGLMDLVNRIRNVRADKGLAPATRLDAVVRSTTPGALEALNASSAEVIALARLSELVMSEQAPQEDGWFSAPSGAYEAYVRVPVEAADPEAERARLEANLLKADKEREKFAMKLANPAFRDKAPEAVVEKTRKLLEEFERKAEALRAALEKN